MNKGSILIVVMVVLLIAALLVTSSFDISTMELHMTNHFQMIQ